MQHISILKEDEDPVQAIAVSQCEGCETCSTTSMKLFHCPLCPPSVFRPLASSAPVSIHLNDIHFSKTVYGRGCSFILCRHDCLEKAGKQGVSHYHCPVCSDVFAKKAAFEKHISICKGVLRSASRRRTLELQNKTNLNNSPTICQKDNDFAMQSYSEICSDNVLDCSSRKTTKSLPAIGERGGYSFIHDDVKSSTSTRNSTEINGIIAQKDAHSVILKYKRTGDSQEFEKVFQDFTANKNADVILAWITCMTECASLLDRKADKLILGFLKLPLFLSQELAEAANNFIRTLIGHHNYYAYHVQKKLFQHLIPVVNDDDGELLVSAGYISKEEEAIYDRVLSAIITINSDIPMTQENLLVLARKNMPYFQVHAHKHAVYACNLLRLANHLPHLRVAVLEVIIANMITIDVHAPRSELNEEEIDEEEMDSSDEDDMFDMEIDDTVSKRTDAAMKNSTEELPLDICQLPKAMSHKVGNTLDVLMSIMLQYVHDVSHGIQAPRIPKHLHRSSVEVNENPELGDGCIPGVSNSSSFDPKRMGGCECGGAKQNIEALKYLYSDLKEVFSNIILRTHASSHVQFLLFYIISLRPGILQFFVDFLMNKKFKDANASQCIRKNAMAYIGSLLARGKHVTLTDMHSCLESIRDWCCDYLDAQERLPERCYEDIRLHGTFYYACQTMFYVFTFRYKQYTENAKTLRLARSLNLERFIHSKLNPLHVCSPPVVNNFAIIAHRFQIAYCSTIIENNKRISIPTARCGDYLEQASTLDSFFPFDPYLLQRSELYIQNHYSEFEGLPEDVCNEDGMEVDERFKVITSPDSFDSIYGISPGFVRFTGESVYT